MTRLTRLLQHLKAGPRGVHAHVLVALAAVLAGCTRVASDPRASVVDVTMREYEFAFDGSAPRAGRVQFHTTNTGQEPHELVLVTLPKDFALSIPEQVRSGVARSFPTLAYLPARGAGADGQFAVDLIPGRYGLVCFIQAADGLSHAAKGMGSVFQVR